VRLDRWQTLTSEQRRGFAPLCSDLVVELASPSDEDRRALAALRSKMAAYQANGAPQRYEGIAVLDAGPVFPCLQLRLKEIWAGCN
jgi:hypothetical protein